LDLNLKDDREELVEIPRMPQRTLWGFDIVRGVLRMQSGASMGGGWDKGGICDVYGVSQRDDIKEWGFCCETDELPS
jgi:hypothetical protein